MSQCVFDRWNGASQARALFCNRPDWYCPTASFREGPNIDPLDLPNAPPQSTDPVTAA